MALAIKDALRSKGYRFTVTLDPNRTVVDGGRSTHGIQPSVQTSSRSQIPATAFIAEKIRQRKIQNLNFLFKCARWSRMYLS